MSSVVNANLTAALQTAEYDEIAATVAAATPAGGRVLDWGCGEGQQTKRLADLGLDVESFDFDPAADGVERRPFKLFPQLSALRSNEPVKLPFDDESFDVVLSCGVLEHVEHPLKSLTELRRILKPGGRLFVYKLPNIYSAMEAIARVGGLPYHGMRTYDTLWGVRSTEWTLDAAGFDVDWVRRANLLPLTVDHPALNRRAKRLWKLNKRLSSAPCVQLLATNIEASATKPDSLRKREIVS